MALLLEAGRLNNDMFLSHRFLVEVAVGPSATVSVDDVNCAIADAQEWQLWLETEAAEAVEAIAADPH
jgi:hypothetical protein